MPSFAEMVQEFLHELYEDQPVMASALGLTEYDDRLDDLSAAAFEARRRRSATWLHRFQQVPEEGLNRDERIDRGLILSYLRGEQIMADWEMWRRQPAVYLGPCLNGVFVLFLHRLRPEAELVEAAASRLRAVPKALEEGRRNLRAALAPAVYVERAVAQVRAAVRYLAELLPTEVRDPILRAQVEDAARGAVLALEDFRDYLERLLANARGSWAIGEERYNRLLREKELLGDDARALRERGRAEYERVAAELRRLARQIAGTDDWVAVLRQLNQDHPPTPDAMRAAYAEWTGRARAFLQERGLVTLPPGEECVVEPSPHFQRPVQAVASYHQPPPFSPSRRGHFFVPYPPDDAPPEDVRKRLEGNCYAGIPTTAVHETYPGHHWHLVTAKANPRPVRHVLRTPFFTEGWALYAEQVMREQGFFTDPRHELYQHEATLFRAARIIVDTSLHLGEMGFDEAVRFMMERANLPEPTARAEVGRYCSWPTQAASYLTGCLEITRIRERFLAERGLSGTDGLRRFHDALAGSGSLPIALAEQALRAAEAR
jgi:uncharacterized protein (DUF885 family)